MSPLRQILILAAVAAVIAAGVVADPFGLIGPTTEQAARRGGAAGGEPRPAPVVVEAVRYASAAAVIEAVGTGQAIQAVTLHPEAAGRVTEILFSPGDRVKKGAPLMRLDDDEEKLALDLAQVHLQDARQQLARYERAAPSGAVASSEVDRVRTTLSAARIELAQAELALRNRTLVAPFDGIVGISEVDVGDRVTEATAVTSLDDRTTLRVDFEVPEAFSYGVGIGGAVTATTWARPGEVFEGEIGSVASRIDRETRTLRVRARIPNANDRLRTGMSFTIRMQLQGERYPSVPSIAVQWDREGAYVWRVAGGKSERVKLRVLKRENDWVLVDAPLERDDNIVVEGVQRLRTGRSVEIVGRDGVVVGKPADGV